MNVGRQSSEFWLAIAAIILDALGAIFNLIPHEQAGALGTAAVVAYNLSRGLAKMRQTPEGQVVKVTPTYGGGSVTVTHTPEPPSPPTP